MESRFGEKNTNTQTAATFVFAATHAEQISPIAHILNADVDEPLNLNI